MRVVPYRDGQVEFALKLLCAVFDKMCTFEWICAVCKKRIVLLKVMTYTNMRPVLATGHTTAKQSPFLAYW